jgi:hypothetical protein
MNNPYQNRQLQMHNNFPVPPHYDQRGPHIQHRPLPEIGNPAYHYPQMNMSNQHMSNPNPHVSQFHNKGTNVLPVRERLKRIAIITVLPASKLNAAVVPASKPNAAAVPATKPNAIAVPASKLKAFPFSNCSGITNKVDSSAPTAPVKRPRRHNRPAKGIKHRCSVKREIKLKLKLKLKRGAGHYLGGRSTSGGGRNVLGAEIFYDIRKVRLVRFEVLNAEK